MKKTIMCIIFMFSIVTLSYGVPAGQMDNEQMLESLKLEDGDIPHGFMFGKIPNFARTVLKENPWVMDRPAIDKLTKRIYPEGNSASVKGVYVSIITREEEPYGDDIVYYALVYKDQKSAENEMKKLKEFCKYNKDRAVVVTRGNVAVYIHVDDPEDFSYVNGLADKVRGRLNIQ